MTGAVSSTSTLSTTATISSAASSSSEVASLKAELAAKQSELAQAKTDDEKSKINAEITKLKAEIAALKTTDQNDTSKASAKGDASRTKNAAQVTAADKSAPESKVSDSAMDVLMRLGPQGGMMPPGGRNAAGGPPGISQIYADMDSDSSGKVTKDEFVSGTADHMSADQAGKVFASIDSQNTGSITEEQLAKSMMHGPESGWPMGPPPGGMGPFQVNQQASDTSSASTTTIAA